MTKRRRFSALALAISAGCALTATQAGYAQTAAETAKEPLEERIAAGVLSSFTFRRNLNSPRATKSQAGCSLVS
jgi:hypothetical protein